jgi:hypothetical protein
MSYARFGEGDVYVYSTGSGVVCVMCSFGDMLEDTFRAESTQEMVDHLAAHERAGDRIPARTVPDLWVDDPLNFPPASSA